MNACELTTSITALANAIACKVSDEQLVLVAAAVAQLGDTLGTIAAQRSVFAAVCEKTETAADSADTMQQDS